MEEIPTHIPIGRCGKPADVAHLVSYLASETASYVTDPLSCSMVVRLPVGAVVRDKDFTPADVTPQRIN